MRRKVKTPRATLIFLTCVLAVPTMACILYGVPEKADFSTL